MEMINQNSSAIACALRYEEYLAQFIPNFFRIREPADFYDPLPLNEKFVQVIWSEQLLKNVPLITSNGLSCRVLHPGQWNGEGGPDFIQAILEINGRRTRGDIEIHLNADGWHQHGHQRNSSYDCVLLDVALWGPASNKVLLNSKNESIPQLILHPYLESSIPELMESLNPDRYPFPPGGLLHALPNMNQWTPESCLQWVESAAFFRMESKIKRAKSSIEAKGSNQAAYEALAGALGYKHNKLVFQHLAEFLPIDTLSLIPTVDEKIDRILQLARKFPIRRHGVRPPNHPDRRLAALAILIHEHRDLDSWFHTQLSTWNHPPECTHPQWSYHYHSTSNKLPKAVALIGKDRWREILINVVIPHTAAQQRLKQSDDTLSPWVRSLKKSTPPANGISKKIMQNLGIKGRISTLIQQGLIQIQQDFEFLLDSPEKVGSHFQTTSPL